MRTLNGTYYIRRLHLLNTSTYRTHLMYMILVLVTAFIFCLPNKSMPHHKP